MSADRGIATGTLQRRVDEMLNRGLITTEFCIDSCALECKGKKRNDE